MHDHNKPRPTHLLHIGKTGGSAIRHALAALPAEALSDLRLHPHATTLRDVPPGESVIFFLRDPLTRFASGFHSRRRKGLPRYHSEWSPLEQTVFACFERPRELAAALADPQAPAHALAVEAMRGIGHLQRYAQWYGDPAYFHSRRDDVLFIGFQESLDRDFATLLKLLGIAGATALPADDVSAHRNPRDADYALDDAGEAARRAWYADDIHFVAQCRDLMAARGLAARSSGHT